MSFSFNSIILFFKPHSLSKNLFLGFSVIFLFSCIYLAASWGKTQVSVIQPRQLMTLWADNKHPFSEQQWRVALNTMKAAVETNPGNAEYYFDLARLYDWNAYQRPIWKAESIKYRTSAIRFYKKSLELRPTWSSAWINLAMSKTLNMEFGDEVKTALLNTMKYGVWETDVFHKVLWISLANWDGMPLTIRQQVKHLIKKTVDKSGRVPRSVQQIVTHFEWQEHLKEVIEEVVNHEEQS